VTASVPEIGLPGLLPVLLPPFLAGAALLRRLGIRPSEAPYAWPGLAWILGAFLAGLVETSWLAAGGSSRESLGPDLVLLVCAAGLLLGGGPRLGPLLPSENPARGGRVFPAVFLLALALSFLFVLRGTLTPIVVGDEATFWALKAKVLYHAGGWNEAFREEMAEPGFVLQKDYPFWNPLLQLRVFARAGGLTQFENRIPIQLFLPALLCVLAEILRAADSKVLGALGMLAYATTWRFAVHCGDGGGDGMVAAGLTVALLGGFVLGRGDSRGAPLAAFGTACALYAKNEGMLYLLAFAAAATLFLVMRRRGGRKPRPSSLLWVLLPAGLLALHWGTNAWFGFESPWTRHGLGGRFVRQFGENVLPVLAHYLGILTDPRHAALVPLLALLLPPLVLRGRIRESGAAVLWLFLIAAFLGQVCVFIATPADLSWHLETAADRLAFHLSPPSFALAIHLLGARFRDGERRPPVAEKFPRP